MANEKRLIDANKLPDGKFIEPRTEWHQGWNDALDAAMSQAPTVDAVEAVHGRWKKFHLGSYDFALRLRCSNCCHVVYEDGFNYCPNCGAKMDLEE